ANVDWLKPTQGSVAKAIEICKVIKPKACLYQGPVDVLKVFDVRFTDHYVRISENRGRASSAPCTSSFSKNGGFNASLSTNISSVVAGILLLFLTRLLILDQ